MRERGTFLHQVIAYHAKMTILRKNHSFVLQRSVSEMESQAVGDLSAAGDLNRIAVGDDLSVRAAQHQETADLAFHLTHRDGLCG